MDIWSTPLLVFGAGDGMRPLKSIRIDVSLPRPPKVDPSIRFSDPAVYEYASLLDRALKTEFSTRPPSTMPQDKILLLSPSGKVYSVQVDDAGALYTTLVQG